MAGRQSSPDAPSSKPWKRYALIGVPLAVAAGVILFVFWDEIRVRGWINRLSNSDPRVRHEQIEALKGHEDAALVDRLLLEAVEDDAKTFEVRMTCANLLLQRQRLPVLERAFANGSVETRGLVLKAFARERWFDKFVEDQGGRVQETVRNWLKQGRDLTRSHAIQLAVQLDLTDLMPDIRPILSEPRSETVHPDVLRNLVIAAAGAAERFKDCESMPRVMELAETHALALVRLRCMQIVDRAVFRGGPDASCAGAIAPEAMGRLVGLALDDDDHAVRMGSMLILARNDAWAPDVTDRLQAILDGAGTPAERRQALETLARLGDAAFLERLPRYFHDSVEVRSSALRAAATVTAVPLTGCLIGLLQDEVDSELVWMDAAKALHKTAGTWPGLPEKLKARAAQDPDRWRRDLSTLYSRGEIEGLTRDAFAEGFFRWWAAKCGLVPEEVDKAVAARAAFIEAKGRGDVTAAEAALDAVRDAPGLFTYERAWLQTRE